MSFYSIRVDEINNIFEEYFKSKNIDDGDNKINFDLNKVKQIQKDEINNIFEEYLKNKSKETQRKNINLYPIELNQIFEAYQCGREKFIEVFEEIHNNSIRLLRENIKRDTYNVKEVFIQLLDDEKCNNLEIQSIAAKCTLERLYTEIMNSMTSYLFYSDIFEGILHSYGDILFDVKCLKGHSFRNKRRVANMQIFPLAKEISEYNFTYQYPITESAIFLFRQAIEVHMKNAFGIYQWKRINEDNTTSDIGIAKLIKYMKQKINEKKVAILIDVDVLILINTWLNTYIHTGIFNYPFWYIEWIKNYLKNFFYEPIEIKNLYKSSYQDITRSIYAEKTYSKKIIKDIERTRRGTRIIPYEDNKMIVVTREEIVKIQDAIKKRTDENITI